MRRLKKSLLGPGPTLLCGLLLAWPQAHGQTPVPPDDGAQPAYKLTLGRYHAGASGNSTDLNLRRSLGPGNVWLGLFDAPAQGERQWRLGADASLAAGAWRWMPAAQIASHRYAAASLGVETGATWFVGRSFFDNSSVR